MESTYTIGDSNISMRKQILFAIMSVIFSPFTALHTVGENDDKNKPIRYFINGETDLYMNIKLESYMYIRYVPKVYTSELIAQFLLILEDKAIRNGKLTDPTTLRYNIYDFKTIIRKFIRLCQTTKETNDQLNKLREMAKSAEESNFINVNGILKLTTRLINRIVVHEEQNPIVKDINSALEREKLRLAHYIYVEMQTQRLELNIYDLYSQKFSKFQNGTLLLLMEHSKSCPTYERGLESEHVISDEILNPCQIDYYRFETGETKDYQISDPILLTSCNSTQATRLKFEESDLDTIQEQVIKIKLPTERIRDLNYPSHLLSFAETYLSDTKDTSLFIRKGCDPVMFIFDDESRTTNDKDISYSQLNQSMNSDSLTDERASITGDLLKTLVMLNSRLKQSPIYGDETIVE